MPEGGPQKGTDFEAIQEAALEEAKQAQSLRELREVAGRAQTAVRDRTEKDLKPSKISDICDAINDAIMRVGVENGVIQQVREFGSSGIYYEDVPKKEKKSRPGSKRSAKTTNSAK